MIPITWDKGIGDYWGSYSSLRGLITSSDNVLRRQSRSLANVTVRIFMTVAAWS